MPHVDALDAPVMPMRMFGRSPREIDIANHVESVVDVASERLASLPSGAECELFEVEFLTFAHYAQALGVGALPAAGHTVALYILELHCAGASLDEIATVVAAVKHAH